MVFIDCSQFVNLDVEDSIVLSGLVYLISASDVFTFLDRVVGNRDFLHGLVLRL